MQFSSFSSSAGLYLLNVAVASVVLSLAAVATGLIVRRRELPLRHGLLSVALSLVLLSPLAIWIATVQGFGIIPISLGEAAAVAETVPTVEPAVASEPMPLVKSDESDVVNYPEQAETAVQNIAPPMSPAADLKPVEQENTTPRFASVGTIGVALVLLWATVALWYMARLVHGMFIMGRLSRSLQLTTDDRIKTAMQVLSAAETKPATPVYESSLAPAPLTLGWWRPVIVMPIGLAKSLSDEELASVLAHEAAHARRHDTVIALLQQLARIGFWWNPLLHRVSRQISQLREKICDDHVVKQYGDGRPLAQAILKVARWSDSREAGLPMVTALLDDGDEVEQRIIRLTKEDRIMSVQLNKKSIVVVGVFAIVLAGILAVPIVRAQVVPESAAKSTPISPKRQKSLKLPLQLKPTGENKPVPRENNSTALFRVSGRTTNQVGKPVAGAKIYLRSAHFANKSLGETTTDSQGRYEFRDVSLPLHIPGQASFSGALQVYGKAEKLGLAWHPKLHYVSETRPLKQPKHLADYYFYQNEDLEMDLTFREAAKLEGTVRDENGQPIADAAIVLVNIVYLDSEKDEWHENYRDFRGLDIISGLHITRARFRGTRADALTDAEGHFEINGLPSDSAAYVNVTRPGFGSQTFYAAISDKEVTQFRYVSDSNVRDAIATPRWRTRPIKASPLDLRLASTQSVMIKVIYEDNRRPAKNTMIVASAMGTSFGSGSTGNTDEQGQLKLSLSPGKYRLMANPIGEKGYAMTTIELIVPAEPGEQTCEIQLKAS